ncbi:hypothetical protein P8A22_27705 [Streptomyces laculatispora]|uniref:Uncharacterized protein n=1 Tax=Streptomyces laculatispora TaxID=887464 RepID=A0ABY9I9S5_9ACTN|nr:hypothetical protein [Streptomyces laculatispora]WLQ43369.1 hypothetical protein P8A22_27705 [Streptomyces laculatispora]
MSVPAHVLDAELDRIASDPETRALFRAELDCAIAEHFADTAESAAFTEAATEALQAVLRLPTGERAA